MRRPLKLKDAKERLEAAKFVVLGESRLNNDSGTQLRLRNGTVVNVFDSGSFSVQGKKTQAVQAILSRPIWTRTGMFDGE
jgi:predicted nucleotide-binding protein